MTDIVLPWGAWYGDAQHVLHIPSAWKCDVLTPRSVSTCTVDEIEVALLNPVDSPPLEKLAQNCRSVCLVVDDIARPTRTYEILPPILQQLRSAGIADNEICIVVALGSHGPPTRDMLTAKLGAEALSRFRVECHDCRQGLASTGIQYGEQELLVNRTFQLADLKIGIGTILPHSFAAFSGGAKLVVPGLVDIDSIARSHKFVQMGLRGGSDANKNRFRQEAENIARRLGMQFCVSVVVNLERVATAVVAGDVVAAHRRATEIATKCFRTDVDGVYDCAILNAWPKDTDLIQAENAFVALKTARRSIVRDGGLYVLTSAASEGIGCHGLFGPGGVSHVVPRRKRGLGSCDLWVYSPNVSEKDIRTLFWDGYRAFSDSVQLETALRARFGATASVAVLPGAAMQQVRTP